LIAAEQKVSGLRYDEGVYPATLRATTPLAITAIGPLCHDSDTARSHNMATATYGGSSDVSLGYTLRSGSRSSTDVSTESSPVETSPPEGYADAPLYRFTGIPDLQNRVDSVYDALRAGRTTQQYLVFRGVTKDHLARIDRQRVKVGNHTRMTHYTDTDLLIIKVPSAEHEAAHLTLSDKVNHKLEGMGLARLSLWPCGSTTYHGFSSSKEGDSAYKPRCRHGRGEWPTLVIEAGFSETLTKLRTDAQWWLTNSRGAVKIVIVVWIKPVEKSLWIEQWCMPLPIRPGPVTRAHSIANTNANANTTVPMKIQELTVIQDPPIPPLPGTIATYTVTGAPLILDFDELLLRAPVPPEGNVILTAADLQAWAEDFWFMLD
jgi:hypothetical protein